jgi:hypothetical protein
MNLSEGDKIVVVRAPFHGALNLIKTGDLEKLIEKMQTRQSKFLETVQNIKDMTDKDSKE